MKNSESMPMDFNTEKPADKHQGKNEEQGMSRRDFIKGAAALGLGTALGLKALGKIIDRPKPNADIRFQRIEDDQKLIDRVLKERKSEAAVEKAKDMQELLHEYQAKVNELERKPYDPLIAAELDSMEKRLLENGLKLQVLAEK